MWPSGLLRLLRQQETLRLGVDGVAHPRLAPRGPLPRLGVLGPHDHALPLLLLLLLLLLWQERQERQELLGGRNRSFHD
jgi:hypothetical protein